MKKIPIKNNTYIVMFSLRKGVDNIIIANGVAINTRSYAGGWLLHVNGIEIYFDSFYKLLETLDDDLTRHLELVPTTH
jgi:hypothetical protein